MAPIEGGEDIVVKGDMAVIIDKVNKKGENNGDGKKASESIINENGFMTIEDIWRNTSKRVDFGKCMKRTR